jgi:hypothetical protein
MGAIVAGKKVTLQNAVTDLQNKIVALGTSWGTLVAAQNDLRTLDDGVVFFGVNPPPAGPGLRVDDILSVRILAAIATDSMLANGLREILRAFADRTQEGSGTADITVTVNNLLSGH